VIERMLPAVAVTLGVTLFLGVSVARRGSSAVDRHGRRAVAADPAPPGSDASSTLPAGSLYDLGLKVVGTDGRSRPLDDWRGHPVLASMFFASCPTACPLLINDLQRLEAALPADLRDETRVLLVSFDPKRDSPAVLEGVVGQHGLDSRRWRVVAAENEDSARLLAAALGIRYRAAAWGMFDHTVRVAVLDGAGRIRARSGDVMALAPALRAAASTRN
jgi:protein SCO1